MAGLLDFGTAQPAGGLLGDLFNDPGARLGMQLLAAGSPRLRGLADVMAQQDHAKQQALQQQYLQAQLEDRTLQTQARQAQMQAAQRKQAALPYLFSGGGAGDGSGAVGDSAAAPQGMPSPQASLNWQRALQAGYTPDEIQKLAGLQNIGRQEVARTIETTDAQGRPITVQFDKFGNRIGDGLAAWKAPVMVNQGAQITAVDPATLQARGSFGVSMSPAERDAAARGWASNNIAQQRLAWDMGGGADVGPGQAGMVRQFGKPPAGYRWKQDGSLEAIPGGPTDIKAGEAGAKAEQRKQAAEASANNVLSAVSDAKNLVGVNTAGLGSSLASIPGTDARNLSSKLETIKANLGFDRLQQMRDMSPTGGALGAVAVQELTALQSTVASLDQGQSRAELTKSLGKIEKHYNNWLKTINGQAPDKPATTGGATGSWGEKPIPTAAINDLKMRGPKAKAQFDEVFGPGAADRVLGGR